MVGAMDGPLHTGKRSIVERNGLQALCFPFQLSSTWILPQPNIRIRQFSQVYEYALAPPARRQQVSSWYRLPLTKRPPVLGSFQPSTLMTMQKEPCSSRLDPEPKYLKDFLRVKTPTQGKKQQKAPRLVFPSNDPVGAAVGLSCCPHRDLQPASQRRARKPFSWCFLPMGCMGMTGLGA